MTTIKYLTILSLLLFIGCIKPTEPYGSGDGGYKIVAKYPTKGWAQDVVLKDSLAYIAQGEGGLEIVNISDPTNPKAFLTLFNELRGYSRKITLYDSIIYLAAGSFGVSVVNVSNPISPIVTETNLEMKTSKSISVFKNFIFTAISEQGIKIAEISIPDHPDIRGRIQTLPGYAQSVTFYKDSLLLVACGEMGFAVSDISKIKTGFETFYLKSWCDTPGYAEEMAVSDESPIAYMACGTGGLQIVDFSDIMNIHIIGSYNTGGYAKEIVKVGNKLYVTTEKRGLQIFSVEDPTMPKLIGVIGTQFALGLAIKDNYIYIADENEGLIIIAIPK